MILKILREHRPSSFAFALDAPQRTFRKERYAEYKAQRDSAPNDLSVQLRRLPALLEAFSVPTWCAPGFEADDVLATLTARLRAQADTPSVLIVSGDRDLLQLVDDRVRVWFIGARGQDAKLFDSTAVRERYGVSPERLPAWTALVGDTSDNLMGAPGIGPKTATQLVSEHGSVAGVLARVAELRTSRIRDSLTQHAERLLMNEELARLRHDVPLEGTPLAGSLTHVSLQRLREAFEDLEFRSLIPRWQRFQLRYSRPDPAKLQLELLPFAFDLVLDRELGLDRDREALLQNLNSDRLPALQRVCETPQGRNELHLVGDPFDVSV